MITTFTNFRESMCMKLISLKRVMDKSKGIQRIITIGLLAMPKFLPRNVCSNLDAMAEN